MTGDAEAPARVGRRGWVPAVAVVAGVAAVIVVLLVGLRLSRDDQDRFTGAQKACDPSASGTRVSDGGATLLIDTKGTEDATGLDNAQLLCVMMDLEAPTSVLAHMDSTRALDGRQDDAWEGFTASWTYHPDNGLSAIVRRA